MASDRLLWKECFPEDRIPPLPCPSCRRGSLLVVNDSLETKYSAETLAGRRHGAWDVSWDRGRFTCFLACGIPQCGEVVAVAGDVLIDERYGQHGSEYVDIYYPLTMVPGPPLIEFPDETPAEIEEPIRQAFTLFWGSRGASANQLRISVERILDHFSIKPGRLVDRIAEFSALHPEHGETFDALRHVGNLGSHAGNVDREALLDAFEVYQDALANLFGRKSERIAELRQKLLNSRGDYREMADKG